MKKHNSIPKDKSREIAESNSDVNKDTCNLKFFNTEEDKVYTEQLRELVKYFSSIEHSGIRQYGINFMTELSKCASEEKARMYTEEMLS